MNCPTCNNGSPHTHPTVESSGDGPDLNLPPSPAEWEAMKAENAKLRTEVERMAKMGPEHTCWVTMDAAQKEALIEQRDKAYREVDAMKLQVDALKKEAAHALACYEKVSNEDDATIERLELQINEVTAHRDRLRDLLNDIRGLLLCPPTDLECQIMRRIEDWKPIEKREGRPRIGGKGTMCDKQYPVDESAYGYCGRDLGHDGKCGRA